MTHHGTIVLRSGTAIPLSYELRPPAADGLYHGKLLGELERLDPALSPDRLKLVCVDGLTIDVLITHYTGHGATFIGTVAPNGTEVDVVVTSIACTA